MHSIKQSNWVLGLGVVVAILLIVTTIWIKSNPDKTTGTSITDKPETSLPLIQVDLGKLRWVSSIIKTLN